MPASASGTARNVTTPAPVGRPSPKPVSCAGTGPPGAKREARQLAARGGDRAVGPSEPLANGQEALAAVHRGGEVRVAVGAAHLREARIDVDEDPPPGPAVLRPPQPQRDRVDDEQLGAGARLAERL